MRRHKDPSRRQLKHRRPPQPRQPPQPPQARGALHPIRGTAPVMWRCTRYVAVHPLRGGAPEQKRCIAYGSGAVPQHTRTNAELAHRTTHRHTPPCAPGPYRWQDGHAAHATTCTPAHSNTSHTLKCEEPANRSRPIRIGEDSNRSAGNNADDLRAQIRRGADLAVSPSAYPINTVRVLPDDSSKRFSSASPGPDWPVPYSFVMTSTLGGQPCGIPEAT